MSVLMQFDLVEEPDHLLCVVTGSYDVREAIDNFAALIARCRATGQSKVLVDYRRMEGYPNAIERIIFSDKTLDLYERHVLRGAVPIRIAFLGSPVVVGRYHPGLEMAKIRGFTDATITSDPEEAMAFLEDPMTSGLPKTSSIWPSSLGSAPGTNR